MTKPYVTSWLSHRSVRSWLEAICCIMTKPYVTSWLSHRSVRSIMTKPSVTWRGHMESAAPVVSSYGDIWVVSIYFVHKRICCKTHTGVSSILHCTRTINKNSYPWPCADLRIFTMYAVKEIKKNHKLFQVNLHWEAKPELFNPN